MCYFYNIHAFVRNNMFFVYNLVHNKNFCILLRFNIKHYLVFKFLITDKLKCVYFIRT